MKKIGVFLILLLILMGCTDDKVEVPKEDINNDNSPIEEQSIKTSKEEVIPKGTLTLFYTKHIGKDTDILPVQVQLISPEGENLGGYGENIKVETDYYGIFGYLPEYDKTYLVHKVYSPSYASNFIYPITKNNKLFIFRDWGVDDGETEIKDVYIVDPKTGKNLYTLSLAPPAGSKVAIVGDKIYYRSSIGTDIYGKRSSGGELYSLTFDGNSQKLLEYGDEFNSGKFYGVNNKLLSVVRNNNLVEIREHDSLGNLISTMHSLIAENYEIYSGENNLYFLNKDDSIYYLYKLYLDGTQEQLMEITLENGEVGVDFDEEGNKLFIITYKDSSRGYIIGAVNIFDLNTKELNKILVEQQISSTSPGPDGDQFYILE